MCPVDTEVPVLISSFAEVKGISILYASSPSSGSSSSIEAQAQVGRLLLAVLSIQSSRTLGDIGRPSNLNQIELKHEIFLDLLVVTGSGRRAQGSGLSM